MSMVSIKVFSLRFMPVTTQKVRSTLKVLEI